MQGGVASVTQCSACNQRNNHTCSTPHAVPCCAWRSAGLMAGEGEIWQSAGARWQVRIFDANIEPKQCTSALSTKQRSASSFCEAKVWGMQCSQHPAAGRPALKRNTTNIMDDTAAGGGDQGEEDEEPPPSYSQADSVTTTAKLQVASMAVHVHDLGLMRGGLRPRLLTELHHLQQYKQEQPASPAHVPHGKHATELHKPVNPEVGVGCNTKASDNLFCAVGPSRL